MTAEQTAETAKVQVVVTVLYGTEYGFSKEISEKLCEQLKAVHRFWPRMVDMAELPGGMQLEKEQALLVVCSTQGDGVPPSEARPFCDWLNSSTTLLPETNYAVCALGDRSYTHFCACGKQLDARLAALEAKQLAPTAEINREDWKAVDKWLSAAVERLSLLKLQTVGELGGYEMGGGEGQQARVSKSRPVMGCVVAVEGLCSVASAADKDTIRVEIDISSLRGGDGQLSYLPGDALGIYASNAPEVAEDLLDFLDADSAELGPLPAWHYSDEQRPPSCQVSLKERLLHCYDLRQPKAELLQLLWDHMPLSAAASDKKSNARSPRSKAPLSNGHHPNPDRLSNGVAHEAALSCLSLARQRLNELLAASAEEVTRYLEPRHVIDVLQDFRGSKPPLQKLLKALRPLQPRLYSISSAPEEAPGRVQVTVAVVKYTSLRKERMGVASTFLAERIQVGDRLPVYVSRNTDFRLPEDPKTPIVMVGPGTGLAPFRSFMMHRILSGSQFGSSLLYFGCRRRDQDFLYRRLLESWQQEGHLKLFTAFSREQGHKVYVQDRLRETGKLVWEQLQAGGHFYVCGDAAHMAKAVESALLDIILKHQGAGRSAADAYLEDLQRSNRYQRDVWF